MLKNVRLNLTYKTQIRRLIVNELLRLYNISIHITISFYAILHKLYV